MRTPGILLATTVVLLLTAPAVVAQTAVTNPGDHITMKGSGAFVVKGPALFVSSARSDPTTCTLDKCETTANLLPNTFAEGEWTVVAASSCCFNPVRFSWAIAGWSDQTTPIQCLAHTEAVVLTLDRTALTWTASCL